VSKKSIKPKEIAAPAPAPDPAAPDPNPSDAAQLDSASLLAVTLDGTLLVNTSALPGLRMDELKDRKLFIGAELNKSERRILRSHVDEASVELQARILGALTARRPRAPKAKAG
jgi:hypothetical protein